MNTFLVASNFFESTMFLFLLTKLFFYNYITITRDKFGKLHSTTNKFDNIRFAAYMIFGIYSLTDLLKQKFDPDTSRSLILEIGVYLKCRLQLIQPLLGAASAFVNRRKIFRLIEKFELIDEKLKTFAITRSYTSDIRFTFKFLGLQVLIGFTAIGVAAAQLFIHNVYHHAIPLENPFFMTGLPCSSLFEFTHVAAVIAVYVRVTCLLKAVKGKSSHPINDLKLINFIYTQLTDVMLLINQVFSFNSLIGLTEYSVHTTLTAFTAYQVLVSKAKFDLLLFVLLGIAYCVAKAQIYFSFIAFASSLRATGGHLWIEINRMESSDRNFAKFREITVDQMRVNELVVSCGVYEFDWIIFFSIMTGAVSYLVVMIQFDVGMG